MCQRSSAGLPGCTSEFEYAFGIGSQEELAGLLVEIVLVESVQALQRRPGRMVGAEQHLVAAVTAEEGDDLGRIAPNSRADLVLVDLTVPQMRPVRDPLRSFIYHAADRAVRDVFIGGQQVVADHKVLTMNQKDAAGRLADAQHRMLDAAARRDYRGRSAEQISPLSLPLVD